MSYTGTLPSHPFISGPDILIACYFDIMIAAAPGSASIYPDVIFSASPCSFQQRRTEGKGMDLLRFSGIKKSHSSLEPLENKGLFE